MTIALDHSLIQRVKRAPRGPELTYSQRLALNVLWRRKVRMDLLVKLFKKCKNTIYHNCLTGDAASYPTTPESNTARFVNAEIDRIGLDEAERLYVSDEIKQAINEDNARIAVEQERKHQTQLARRRARHAAKRR
jgi:hypothetical protein